MFNVFSCTLPTEDYVTLQCHVRFNGSKLCGSGSLQQDADLERGSTQHQDHQRCEGRAAGVQGFSPAKRV